jgi:hypothetical protein
VSESGEWKREWRRVRVQLSEEQGIDVDHAHKTSMHIRTQERPLQKREKNARITRGVAVRVVGRRAVDVTMTVSNDPRHLVSVRVGCLEVGLQPGQEGLSVHVDAADTKPDLGGDGNVVDKSSVPRIIPEKKVSWTSVKSQVSHVSDWSKDERWQCSEQSSVP